jgi:hypothetical protein
MNSDLVSIESLARGAIVERFHDALEQVIKNICDPNTRADAPREIAIKVLLKPDDGRHMAAVRIDCNAKLAPPIAVGTAIFLGESRGRVYASESNPDQPSMFDVDRDLNNINRDKDNGNGAR